MGVKRNTYIHTYILRSNNFSGKGHLKNLDTDGRMKLKRMLDMQVVKAWTGFN
jgi:hypothetical protein